MSLNVFDLFDHLFFFLVLFFPYINIKNTHINMYYIGMQGGPEKPVRLM